MEGVVKQYCGQSATTRWVLLNGLLAFLLIAHQSALVASEDNQTLDGAIAGYSAGGMISVLGEGLTAMARAQYPGSSLTYEPGNPVGGLVKMVAGKRPFSMQTPLEIAVAMVGEPPFRRAYDSKDFSVIARVVDDMAVQIIMRAGFLREHDITGLQGVADKQLPLRLSANMRGNLLGQIITERILMHYGLDFAQVVAQGGEVINLPTRASAELIRNRKLDMVVTAAFTPSSRLIEIATATDIELLSLPAELITSLTNEFGFETASIPAETYPFLHADLPSMTTGFLLTAGSQTTFADGYKMAKALHQQFDLLRGLHPAFTRFKPDMLLRTGAIPLHPGAEAYFREAGLLTN